MSKFDIIVLFFEVDLSVSWKNEILMIRINSSSSFIKKEKDKMMTKMK